MRNNRRIIALAAVCLAMTFVTTEALQAKTAYVRQQGDRVVVNYQTTNYSAHLVVPPAELYRYDDAVRHRLWTFAPLYRPHDSCYGNGIYRAHWWYWRQWRY